MSEVEAQDDVCICWVHSREYLLSEGCEDCNAEECE